MPEKHKCYIETLRHYICGKCKKMVVTIRYWILMMRLLVLIVKILVRQRLWNVPRYTSRYDSKGKYVELVDGVVTWMRDDYVPPPETNRSTFIMEDMKPFRSPVDGSIVDGRVAYKAHNKRNNVVPTEDLKGLPPKPLVMENSKEHREETKRVIAQLINERY